MNLNKFNALKVLYPNAIRTVDDVAYDANGNIVEYDKAAVQAYVDAHAYIAKRQAEYPSLADFADAYYWMQKGQTDLMDEYVAKCDAVKNKFPKETT